MKKILIKFKNPVYNYIMELDWDKEKLESYFVGFYFTFGYKHFEKCIAINIL